MGDELDHVERGFEGGVGESEPPAALADPLEQADHVALAVVAVAQHALLVAELEGAEEDEAPVAVGEQPADRPLRAGQLDEVHRPGAGRDPAVEAGIGDIIEQALALAADLEHPAAIVAGRRRDALQRRVGIEQDAFAPRSPADGRRPAPWRAPAPRRSAICAPARGR